MVSSALVVRSEVFFYFRRVLPRGKAIEDEFINIFYCLLYKSEFPREFLS